MRAKLKEGWSPELIAGRIGIDQPGLSISHEAIYQYIYHPDTESRQELIQCLRRAHRKRRGKGVSRKERKSRYLMLTKLDAKTAEATYKAVVNRLRGLPARARRTLTFDNGTENAMHQEITNPP